MFTVTKAAGARLALKLEKKEAGQDAAMRFVRDEERAGWSVLVDKACETDIAFSHNGRKVLVVDEEASHLLRNKILDIKEADGKLCLHGR